MTTQVQAKIVLSQSGVTPPAGYTAGSLDGLAVGTVVNAASGNEANVVSHSWQLVPNINTTVAGWAMSGGSGASITLTPPAAGDAILRLTVQGYPLADGSPNVDTCAVVLGVRASGGTAYAAGIPIPHYQETSGSGGVYVDASLGREGRVAEMGLGLIALVGAGGGGGGSAGVNAFTTTTANFTQPAVSSAATISVANTAWMAVGDALYITGGGYYTVNSILSSISVRIINTGATGNASVGATVGTGAAVVAGGVQGPAGAAGATGPTGPTGAAGTSMVLASGTLTVSGSVSSYADTTLYTCPGSGNTRATICAVEFVVHGTVSAGNLTLVCGKNGAGASNILASQTINSATALGQDFGVLTSQAGAFYDANRFYKGFLNATDTIVARLTNDASAAGLGSVVINYNVLGNVT